MKKEQLYEVLGDINENYINDAHKTAKKKSRPVWVKWGAIAACLCLIVATVISVKFSHNHDTLQIISQYEGQTSDIGSYQQTPKPGEYFCFADVNKARKHYEGENVKYLLSFDIFKPDSELTTEEKIAEYQRLVILGYELYTVEKWTYQAGGEKKYYSLVVGLFTEKDIADFNVNPRYGYVFHFEFNGDGSSISIDENNVIIDINDLNEIN